MIRMLKMVIAVLLLSAGLASAEYREKLVAPVMQSPVWNTIAKLTITTDPKTGSFSAVIPHELQILKDQEVTLDGYPLQFDMSENTMQHFVLSRDFVRCPYCFPSDPSRKVEVMLDRPMAYSPNPAFIKGTVAFINDRQGGLFVKLTDAVIVDPKKLEKASSPPPSDNP